ncbi:amidohydrolase [Vreelandella zhaodongensis]|uniref:Amidohydrolase n=1 Tax=Vreelandella zhaodongensis TaxID=1176240 RepID=A0ABX2SWZ7_VREZH|nr:amidohydrolase [Halomonas zhaodongensis]NYS46004.1 amidohydrolase [Halomonas zhaodongensis]
MSHPNHANALKVMISEQVERNYAEIADLYRTLHRYPELPFREYATSARLAEALEALGYDVTRGVGGTGVVALMRQGSGPTVMLRGDMDALPIQEQTGLEYASQETVEAAAGECVPVMHACGHDLHSSCLVGAAAIMASLRNSWRGVLMLVCQPAEEVLGGAKAMLSDGLYERFPRPDIILGQHNTPALAGTVGHASGRTMSASTSLAVTIHGTGGHAAKPAQAVDPVVIAAYVVTRLQTIVAREISPSDAIVVTVGKLQAGTQSNIIPDRAELEINVRSFDDHLHADVLASIRRIVRCECEASGTPQPPEFRVLANTITLNNDVAHTAKVRHAHADYFGDEALFIRPPISGSEDFPYFGDARAGGFDGDDIPYVYWFIGSTAEEQWRNAPGDSRKEKLRHLPMPHSPYYAPGQAATIKAGMAALTTAALAYLSATDA